MPRLSVSEKKNVMPVSSELSCMLEAIAEPAFLIRPEDMTVAAVNAAFSRAFGAFRFEGKACWEALHRADDCARCGLGCPLAEAAHTQAEAHLVQTIYSSSRVKRFFVSMRPIRSADGRTVYWLERVAEQKGLGATKYTRGQVGVSQAHMTTLREMARAAQNAEPVLIAGEAGLGKELYARTVHENSSRASQPFVTVAGAALTENNAEKFLFGDAFATPPTNGLVQRAGAGTLFIREAADVALSVQKMVEEGVTAGVFYPKGRAPVPADFRLMATSAFDLQRLAAVGSVYAPFARLLNEEVVRVAPLRERPEDIEPLARHFVRAFEPVGRRQITPDVIEKLRGASWPGNVRELQRVLENAAAKSAEGAIRPEDIDLPGGGFGEEELFAPGAKIVPLETVCDRYLARVVREFNGSRAELARLLGVSERTLYRLADRAQVTRRHKPKD